MLCLCNSGKEYYDCCRPFHEGAFPPTALALMRSRYSAYALHKAEYIIKTTHKDNKSYQSDRDRWVEEILFFSKHTQFIRLEILEEIEDCLEAYVTFKAHLIQNQQKRVMVEKSYFVKEGGRWFYREAVSLDIYTS